MPQVLNFFFEELTPRRLKLQSVKSKALQHCLQAFNLFFLHTQKNNDIIQVDQTGWIIQLSQAIGYQSLEGCWSIA